MARPRKHNIDLPPCVYLRSGSYYLVKQGKWLRIGKNLADISMASLPIKMSMEKAEILKFAYKVLGTARQNARGRRGIIFELTRDDLHRMLNEAGWQCAVTRTEFTLEVINGKRPFAPSIDRIDSRIGYLPGNCRIVCVAANYAMNCWGEMVLKRLLRNLKVGISKSMTESTVASI